ncbi:Dipicolinate synthase subunit A [Pandoraea terrae]|uniref:Dipicolinate synthase subunit A n=1 Tax=Pandoraea terrae TaxID=1537710 RepID=A0A5E4ZFM9_9BURK|nr:dipicolinate synthase subunit DpsA [Pandoraea terrae]VVE59658.1 Dipicolinate synthase subunit A [Pandoraea terrae]
MTEAVSQDVWRNTVIAVVGGDEREQEIARLAALTGAQVRGYGFPWPAGGIAGVTQAECAADAFDGADFALFPIPGIAPNGALFAPEAPAPIIPDAALLGHMRPGAHIILGWADANLKRHAEATGIGLHEYEWDEDLMLLRGPAIIEGLLKVVIENTRITIHKSRVGIVGQGTIGFLLTRYMVALGAQTHVFARNAVQRAAAHAANANAHALAALPAQAAELDMLFSTVPARVIGEDVLARLPAHALVVDMAAPPGGVDFEAASALGRRALWARGLGRRAPVTVGASQWSGIRPRIEAILKETR